MDDEPRFLNPFAEIVRHSNRLPHWQQPEATYFVTFRLADSLPVDLAMQWQEERDTWLRCNPRPWSPKQEHEYRKRFTGAVERWLDECHGECLLRQPILARVVADALDHFEGIRYHQHAWIIMPNHVHALFSLLGEMPLEVHVQSWKGFTARAINRRIERVGTLWQKDYHDRMVRNLDHFVKCARYIRRNPTEARLERGEYLLYECSAVIDLLAGDGGTAMQ